MGYCGVEEENVGSFAHASLDCFLFLQPLQHNGSMVPAVIPNPMKTVSSILFYVLASPHTTFILFWLWLRIERHVLHHCVLGDLLLPHHPTNGDTHRSFATCPAPGHTIQYSILGECTCRGTNNGQHCLIVWCYADKGEPAIVVAYSCLS